LGTTLETPFSPLSFGKSFMKICSAVPENGCLFFCGRRKKNKTKKTKKNKQKNIRKTYTHPHHRRLRKTGDGEGMEGMVGLYAVFRKKHPLTFFYIPGANYIDLRQIFRVCSSEIKYSTDIKIKCSFLPMT